MTRLGWLGLASLATATLVASAPRPAHGATRSIALDGVTVWATAVPNARTIAVRLELDAGVLAETSEPRHGLAAAALAALLRGPTPRAAANETESLSDQSGLATEVSLERSTVAITQVGLPAALPRALWIALERLAGPRADRADARSVRAGLWVGAEGSRHDAVSPAGDVLDTALERALGGPAGRSAFASRLDASQADDATLVALIRHAARRRGRLIVAGPPTALRELDRLLADVGAELPRGRAADPAATASGAPVPAGRPAEPIVRLANPQDRRRLVGVAWDLRGAAAGAGLRWVDAQAALAVIEELLAHRGGPLYEQLVAHHAVAHDVDVRLESSEAALALAVGVEVRGDAGGVTRLLVDEVERFARTPLSAARVAAAARLAASDLRLRWSHPASRAALVGNLVREGQVATGADADAWLGRIDDALDRVRPDTLQRFASWALRDDRRVVVQVEPTGADGHEIVLDSDAIADYLRLMVDIRCPPEGGTAQLVDLLEQKYGLSPQKYVAVTRAIADDPARMRELSRDAAHRCMEFKKLRSLVPSARALKLHRAVACGPARIADEAVRERALARVFRRFDLDPSVYRPLLAMVREDLEFGPRVEAIDAECKPRYGPGVPRR